jgi:hypothetical protein
VGKIEWKRRRGRKLEQLLDSLQERRIYWNLNEEAFDRTVWKTHFGRGCGPVEIQAEQ